jgi:hypothetical protein
MGCGDSHALDAMMRSAYAALVGSGFFVYLLALQLVSAGTAPPATVAALITLDAAIAVVVFFRVPVYLQWYTADHGALRAAVEGACAGLGMGVALLIILGVGSGRLPAGSDLYLWMPMSAVFGVTSALSIYLLGALWNPTVAEVGLDQ